jgi:hypothetical protein
VIPLDAQDVAALTATALTAVRQEYPHWLAQEVRADTELLRPRQLSPAFYGSYDWHSAVHNHWLLVRRSTADCPIPWPHASRPCWMRTFRPLGSRRSWRSSPVLPARRTSARTAGRG